MTAFDELFKRVAGEPISGGCDMCEADQVVEQVKPGVHVLEIRHEDNCPVLRASRAKTN